jgi:hypothetical protein
MKYNENISALKVIPFPLFLCKNCKDKCGDPQIEQLVKVIGTFAQ